MELPVPFVASTFNETLSVELQQDGYKQGSQVKRRSGSAHKR